MLELGRLSDPRTQFQGTWGTTTSPFILSNPHLVQRKHSCSRFLLKGYFCARWLNLPGWAWMSPAILKKQPNWISKSYLKMNTKLASDNRGAGAPARLSICRLPWRLPPLFKKWSPVLKNNNKAIITWTENRKRATLAPDLFVSGKTMNIWLAQCIGPI